MATYKYVAVGPDGTEVKAAAEAMSEEALRNELLARNLEVLKVREKRSFSEIEITKKKVKPTEIMHFSRQLAAFVRAGIPLADALITVEEGVTNERLKGIILDAAEAIHTGVPLSEALEPHNEVFPRYYLGILRSAEVTGNLDTVLDQLATYMDRELEARSKVKSALTYPAVIGVMAVVTVVILVAWVLPRFVTFFDEFDSELPLPTRMLLNTSDFFQTWWWAMGLTVVAIVVGYVVGMKNLEFRYRRDALFLRIPLIGEIIQYSITERFCRIVAAMMRAGVPLTEAMNTAVGSMGNEVFREGLADVSERMLEGEGMAAPIVSTDLLPTAAAQMLRVGEETGTLDDQLEQAASFFSRELDYKLKRLTTIFEPAIIIAMGFVVGFVAVALVSAMYGVLGGMD